MLDAGSAGVVGTADVEGMLVVPVLLGLRVWKGYWMLDAGCW